MYNHVSLIRGRLFIVLVLILLILLYLYYYYFYRNTYVLAIIVYIVFLSIHKMNTSKDKHYGKCSVCLGSFRLQAEGILYKHGKRSGPCAGSGTLPCAGSVTESPVNQQPSQQSQLNASDITPAPPSWRLEVSHATSGRKSKAIDSG